MKVLVTTISAVIPSLLLLWFFYKRDLHPEPRGLLIRTFLLGIVIVVPVVVVATPLRLPHIHQGEPVLLGLYYAFVCAAIPEEAFKFLVVTRYSARKPAFDEPMDGVVYGATASLGFATFENILYVAKGGWGVALARAFTSVPCHACLGAIMGYYVGQSRFGIKRKVSAWTGLWVAVLLHGLYDFPLLAARGLERNGTARAGLAPGMLVFFAAVLVFEIIWTLRILRRLRREQIRDAVLQPGAGE